MAARFYDAKYVDPRDGTSRQSHVLDSPTASMMSREDAAPYPTGWRNAEPSQCSMSVGRMAIEAEQRSASERQCVLSRTLGLLVSAGGQQTLAHLAVDRTHRTIVPDERRVVVAQPDLAVPFVYVLWSRELRRILILCHSQSIRRCDGPTMRRSSYSAGH